jgi:hypothetical protein
LKQLAEHESSQDQKEHLGINIEGDKEEPVKIIEPPDPSDMQSSNENAYIFKDVSPLIQDKTEIKTTFATRKEI